MKISDISKIMDIAEASRTAGHNFVPCFRALAGVGKSQGVQQWAAAKGYTIYDLRAALLDSTDILGLPFYDAAKGTTVFAPPDILPQDDGKKYVLFIDEINRGTTAVMNAFMQLLTDRRIGIRYKLPDSCLMVAAINPDTDGYEVNSMDDAVISRLIMVDIDFDLQELIAYARKVGWSSTITDYLSTGVWKFTGKKDEQGVLVNPRSWGCLNAADAGGAPNNPATYSIICQSILGKRLGAEFWTFATQERPITLGQLTSEFNKYNGNFGAMPLGAKLTAMCTTGGKGYRGDLVSLLEGEILQAFTNKTAPTDDLIYELLMVFPADITVNLLKNWCAAKSPSKDPEQLRSAAEGIRRKYPKLAGKVSSGVRA